MNEQQSPQPNIQPEIPRQKTNLPIWAIVMIIALSVIVVGGVSYASYKYFTPEPIPEPIACAMDAKICPDGSSVVRIPPDCEFAPCPEVASPTADWQTYRNEEYGFEVKYPQNLDIHIELIKKHNKDMDIISLTNKNIGPALSKKGDFLFRITRINNEEKLKLTDWFDKNILPGLTTKDRMSIENTTIDNYPAIKITLTHWEEEYAERLYIKSNSELYEIKYSAILEDKETMKKLSSQILSTFIFFNLFVDETINWQIYSGSKFSYKCPQDWLLLDKNKNYNGQVDLVECSKMYDSNKISFDNGVRMAFSFVSQFVADNYIWAGQKWSETLLNDVKNETNAQLYSNNNFTGWISMQNQKHTLKLIARYQVDDGYYEVSANAVGNIKTDKEFKQMIDNIISTFEAK